MRLSLPASLLCLSSGLSAAGLGAATVVDYGAPAGWDVEPAVPDSSWALLEQNGGEITLVPLALDTIALPALRAWNGSDTLLLDPPLLVVERTMPDTSYAVSPFPAPAPFVIPPGFPEDYLEAHRFWLLWGEPPGSLLAPVLAGAAAVAALAALFVLARRRRKTLPAADSPGMETGSALPARMRALLDCPAMAAGDWKALFTEIDRLMRALVEARFRLDTSALTYRQMGSEMKGRPDWKRFAEDFSSVIREVTLQRYAGWGTTRDEAGALIRAMADSAERWLK